MKAWKAWHVTFIPLKSLITTPCLQYLFQFGDFACFFSKVREKEEKLKMKNLGTVVSIISAELA